jgi:Tfp pilus assembly protein FimT
MRSERGFHLIELVLILALSSVLLTLAGPPLLRAAGDLRLRLAAEELVSALRSARWQAIRRGAHVAVRFWPAADGGATYAMYRDGDGDGVLNKDIASGVDSLIMPSRRVEQAGKQMRFGFPAGRRVRDTSGRLMDRLDDPIRFNDSDLASFGPLGTATPGSVYLTDGRDRLVAVRVLNRTGKVQVLLYDVKTERWR